ncbi:hypothetical protein PFISCL1PPCAC_18197, partial [Pristionchus fissidentatus]
TALDTFHFSDHSESNVQDWLDICYYKSEPFNFCALETIDGILKLAQCLGSERVVFDRIDRILGESWYNAHEFGRNMILCNRYALQNL